MFIFISFFFVVGGIFKVILKLVLGGVILVMFVMVVVGGLKLLVSYVFDRCSSLIIVCVLGMVIGVMMVFEVLD